MLGTRGGVAGGEGWCLNPPSGSLYSCPGVIPGTKEQLN